ncbi:unnamed protein product [Diabrotica balteata]|uniref:DNA helicase Pif1-like 2B domain-containing protein n=1 Tax=Diabrotica balteata TaxID=107213 RepID=A0A9N9XCX8_DIABA|nr:unnamed protein product [Diabrotica balteata]
MPRKRKGADLSRNTSRSRSMRDKRSQRTEEQVQQQNADARESIQQLCQEQSENTRAERNKVIRLEQRQSRRFTVNIRRTNDQQRQQVHRTFTSDSFLRLAFQYESDIEYYAHSKVVIGAMDKEYPHCHALKFKNEPPGMCCASGKVQLPEIETPPEPLTGLLIKQQLLPGNLVSYKSIDTVCDASEAVNIPTEFFNSLDLPGMSPHNLQLKAGSPFILLRNLNPPRLCNGTRLVIPKLMKNVIEASILNGKFKGENILIPQISIIPTDVPIQFKRIQFPIRWTFAMTINKSQGQTMSICGLDLSTPCFSHRQLYVACSRVGKPSSLFVLNKDGLTKNIDHAIALRD